MGSSENREAPGLNRGSVTEQPLQSTSTNGFTLRCSRCGATATISQIPNSRFYDLWPVTGWWMAMGSHDETLCTDCGQTRRQRAEV